MKLRKILSGTAAFTMVFSFFSGIQVSAGETVTLDQKIITRSMTEIQTELSA